jgi:hypothetical protein
VKTVLGLFIVFLLSVPALAGPDLSLLRCLRQSPSRLAQYQSLLISNDEFLTDRMLSEEFGTTLDSDISRLTSLAGRLVCGISITESKAISAYTSSFYEPVNRALRTRVLLSKYLPYIRTLSRAMQKLAPYRGTVLRGTNLEYWNQMRMRFRIQRTYQDRAFMSTSRNSPFGAEYRLAVESKTCRYIAPFSVYPNEEEVLCLPSTKFRVKKFDVPRRELFLEELP